MSMMLEKVAPVLMPSRPAKRVRPYKARVSTKVKWALGDAMDRTAALQTHMRKILEWLEEQRLFDGSDQVRQARLGRLSHEIAWLEAEVAELDRILTRAVAECKPAQNNK